MMRLAAILLASQAGADPLFEDRSASLPNHIYGGGWEHFVGGGVAVFDCDGNGLPDLFAAGGENPAKLMRNEGDFAFLSWRQSRSPALPEPTHLILTLMG